MDNKIDGFLQNLQRDLQRDMNNMENDEPEEADMSFLEKNKEEAKPEVNEDYEETTVQNDTDGELVNNAAKTAKLLNTSKQTVRNYTMEYPDFIKPFTDENGTVFYSDRDLEIMRSIADYKKQRMDPGTIRTFLSKKYGEPEETLPAPTENNLPSTEELALLISTKVEERIRSVFEYEVKNITTRLDGVSNSMDEINGLLKNNTESVNKQESLTKSLEGAVSRSADVVSDLQKNVTSKIDRSISRNEASFSKLQESMDKSNELLENELKIRLDDNKNSLNGIQKDMERIKSNNLNKKVDELGRSIQDSLEKDKKERESQNKELIKIINDALVPPEYHPEESEEYKKLSENYEKTRQALEKARSAVENMNSRLNEQDEKLEEKEKLITSHIAQLSALNQQVQRLKALNKKINKRLESTTVINQTPFVAGQATASGINTGNNENKGMVNIKPDTEVSAEISQENIDNREEESNPQDDNNIEGPDAMDMLNDLKKTMGKNAEVKAEEKAEEKEKIIVEPPKKRKRFFGLF